jgi:hypothetical protein
MPFEYRPPTRLSKLLRSGPLFWGAFAVVVIVLGLYVAQVL